MASRYRPDFPPKEREQWEEIIPLLQEIGAEKVQKLLDGEGIGLSLEEKLERDMKLRRLKSMTKEYRDKYKLLSKKYDRVLQEYNDFSRINKEYDPSKIPLTELDKEEEVAICQWSDWHVGESVTEETTEGMNKFDQLICSQRVERLINKTLHEINIRRKHFDVSKLIVNLGGDFMGGYIHPELEQTNLLSPVEEVIFATRLLSDSLATLRDEGGFERIVVLCDRGNHGRTTRRMQYANAYETSYETLLYVNLQSKFPEFDFQISKAPLAHYEIGNFVIRHFHGEEIRYRGGIGGLTIPLNKKLAGWNSNGKANLNLMGHYHHFSMPNAQTSLNGSLVGWNAYAMAKGIPYEPPIQTLMFYSPEKEMVSARMPILCL